MVATLSSLIATAVSTINSLTLVPTGAIGGFVTSISPPSHGPLAGDVANAVQFEVGWVGDRECGDEDQVLTGSLDVLADGVPVASKHVAADRSDRYSTAGRRRQSAPLGEDAR